jgi:hypothetical protein
MVLWSSFGDSAMSDQMKKKEGKISQPASVVEGDDDFKVWRASRRRDTNRPININQQHRCKQMLTAMETHSTGLHRPNETSKMMLFIVFKMI